LEAYQDEPRVLSLARRQSQQAKPAAEIKLLPRPGIQLAWPEFVGRTPPDREWIIPHWIPARHVTLLAGRGGVGKSLLAQHLGSAIATGVEYMEVLSTGRRVLMWASEDDADELWRRQIGISSFLDQDFAQLDNFVLRSCVGVDVTLAAPVFNSLSQAPMLKTLEEECKDLKAEVVILDNVARIFGGNENDRHQVTTFVAWIQAACAPAAVLLLGHPAKAVGSEFSGSSAWEGAVRARLYFSDRPPDQPAEEDEFSSDPKVRYLSRRKANYSELDMRKFNLHDGVLIPEAPQKRQSGAHGDYCCEIVLRAVRKLSDKGIYGTSSTASPSYLPKLAKQYQLLENASESSFARAMREMVMNGALVNEKVGAYPNRTPKMGLVISAQMERTNGS
jgi:archaellum biogenesis ATPase FlaH